MKAAYQDITSRLGKPLWHDEEGVPRYEKFHPELVSNIYAQEAVLVRILCQGCGTPFDVAMTWDGTMMERRTAVPSLQERVERGSVYYGDPPNMGCCASGPTMTSEPDRILEFWVRENMEWARKPELEVELNR